MNRLAECKVFAQIPCICVKNNINVSTDTNS